MDKICIICKNDGKYKCPTCLVYYCSSRCCQKHRETECEVLMKQEMNINNTLNQSNQMKFASEDTVSLEKLTLLRGDTNLKNLLCNPHLRNLLITINNANDADKIMQMAMQEPIFVEFADACLRIVEPPHSDRA